MATQREIRKRIQSVTSTRKITNTMEMISTSKMKKMQNRLVHSKPFELRLELILYYLRKTGYEFMEESLIKERPDPSKILIIMVSGNRGLCGGYNSNVIDNTLSFKESLEEKGRNVQIHVYGKKGTGYFKFIDYPTYKSEINPEDKISFKSIGNQVDGLINLFNSGEFDEIYVSHTGVVTTTTFKPAIHRLIPISINDLEDDEELRHDIRKDWKEFPVDYLFEPNPEKILSGLLPMFIKMKLYTSLMESNFAEQFARRVAMKNATDAASDMLKELTIKYNRARQAKITNEIAEIVGGASALE